MVVQRTDFPSVCKSGESPFFTTIFLSDHQRITIPQHQSTASNPSNLSRGRQPLSQRRMRFGIFSNPKPPERHRKHSIFSPESPRMTFLTLRGYTAIPRTSHPASRTTVPPAQAGQSSPTPKNASPNAHTPGKSHRTKSPPHP